MALKNCPCCHNHCSVKNLGCSKGKKYFASKSEEQESEDSKDDKHAKKSHLKEEHEAEQGHEHKHGNEQDHGHKHEKEQGHEHKHEAEREDDHSKKQYSHEKQHGKEEKGKMKDYEQKDDLYSLLRSCGHYLHHSTASAGDPELFSALNEQQKNELKETLKLLRKSWKSD